MKMHQQIYTWGLLIAGMGLPHAAWAVSGCSTSTVRGAFDAQISNLAMQNFVAGLNAAPASTKIVPGFAQNPNSLIGSQTATGRYYFDGAGNVIGVTTGSRPISTGVGKYTVNPDCTARVTMDSGASYDAVIVQGGKSILFVRTDAGGGGNVGTLIHSGSCAAVTPGTSYGFSFSAANSPDGTTFGPLSSVGEVTLLQGSAFTATASTFAGGRLTRATLTGTYSVGADCTVNLKFTANAAAPAGLSGVLVDASRGLMTLQVDKTTAVTGEFIAQ